MAVNIEDLRLFLRVASLASLSGAGRELGLSPAATSKRIAQLEAELRSRLLHRTTRQVRLTEEGAAFHGHAQRIVAEADAARIAVGAGDHTPRGLLRATVPASFGRQHVSPVISDFLERYPDLGIDLHLTDSVVDVIEEGFDVAIRIGALPDSTLVARRLASVHRVVCAAPSYLARHGTPRCPEDLRDHSCLLIGDQRSWSFETPDGHKTVRVSSRLRTNNGEVLRDAVVGGIGIALKSTWDIGHHLQNGDLTVLLADYPVSTDVAVWAIYPSARYLAPKVRAFIDFFAERFGPRPYWDEGVPIN